MRGAWDDSPKWSFYSSLRVNSAIYNKLILDMNPCEALNSSCQRKLSTLLVITCACLIHCHFNVPLSRVLLSDMIVIIFYIRMFALTITRYDYFHMLSIWELVPICKSLKHGDLNLNSSHGVMTPGNLKTL